MHAGWDMPKRRDLTYVVKILNKTRLGRWRAILRIVRSHSSFLRKKPQAMLA